MKNYKKYLLLLLTIYFSNNIKSQSKNYILECTANDVVSWVVDNNENYVIVLDTNVFQINYNGELLNSKTISGRYWKYYNDSYYALLADDYSFNGDQYQILKYDANFTLVSQNNLGEFGHFDEYEIYNDKLYTVRYQHPSTSLYIEKYNLEGELIASKIVNNSGSSPDMLLVLDDESIILYDTNNHTNFIYLDIEFNIISSSLSQNFVPGAIAQLNDENIIIVGKTPGEDGLNLLVSEKNGEILESYHIDDEYSTIHDITIGNENIFIRTEAFFPRNGKIHLLNKNDLELICTTNFNTDSDSYYTTLSRNSVLIEGKLIFASGVLNNSALTVYEADCSINSDVDLDCTDFTNSTELTNNLNIKILPNPTNSNVSIIGTKEKVCIEIYNSLGILIKKNCNQLIIDLTDMPSGQYNAIIHELNSNTKTVKTITKL